MKKKNTPKLDLLRDVTRGTALKLHSLADKRSGWQQEPEPLLLHRHMLATLLVCSADSKNCIEALKKYEQLTHKQSLLHLLRQAWTALNTRTQNTLCNALDIDPLEVTDTKGWLTDRVIRSPKTKKTMELCKLHLVFYGKEWMADVLEETIEHISERNLWRLIDALELNDEFEQVELDPEDEEEGDSETGELVQLAARRG